MAKDTADRLTYTDLKKTLSKNEISPVYIFTGSQIYLMDQAVEELKKAVVPATADFNFSVFYGDSTSAKEVVDTAKTYPMLSKMRLVVLKNAEKLPPGEIKTLDTYLSSPSPSTSLVLIFGEEKKPALQKSQAVSVHFGMDAKDIYEIIKDEAGKLGCGITKDAVIALVSLVGESLQDIHNEVEKLALFMGNKGGIKVEDVEKFTQKAQFEDVFQFINAVAAKDKKRALKAMLELESAKEEPLAVLNTVTRRFRLIWKAKELIEKRTPPDAIMKELKVSKGALYYIQQQAKNFSYEDIKRMMNVFNEGDRMLKTSYIPKNLALTRVVLELCR